MAEQTSQKPEAGKRRTGVIGPWAFCLLSPAFCFLPAGCLPDDVSVANDPLLGGGPAVRPPGGAGMAQVQPAGGVVPPLPQTAPSGTPAALASTTRGPLDPTRPELRIGSDGGAPAWQASGGPGVALQAPQPISGGAVALQPRPVAGGQPAGGATTASYEQLRARLLQRGAAFISIKTDLKKGETSMSCIAPSKGDPARQQHYDVTGARDEVSAMQALLEKIDRGQ